MREIISDKDIGTIINFRTVGPYQALHPWPEETTVSASKGIASRRDPVTGKRIPYQTLFMEVYPPGAAFIRGEGETPEACENEAWAKYQVALHCTDGSGTHDWEPRNYHNGAGFCSRCNTFGSQVFTAEQLGQFCTVCQAPTMWHSEKNDEGQLLFTCEEHTPKRVGWPFDDDDDDTPVEVNSATLGAALGELLNTLVDALENDPEATPNTPASHQEK